MLTLDDALFANRVGTGGLSAKSSELGRVMETHPTTMRIFSENVVPLSLSLPLSLFSALVNQPFIVRGLTSPPASSSIDLPCTSRFASSAQAEITSG